MRDYALLLLIPLALSAQPAPGRGGPGSGGRGGTPAPPPTPAADLATIEGQVFSAIGGAPLRKANINLNRQNSGPMAPGTRTNYTTATDASGRFAITGIEPGTYRLSASHVGYLDTSYNARRPGGNGTPLDLGKAQRMTNAILKLTPHGLISGKITDEDGDPLENVQVQVLRFTYNTGRKQLQQVGNESTNDAGEFRISKLNPDKYFLCAVYRNRRPNGAQGDAQQEDYATTYYPNGADISTASPVEVGPGDQVQGMNIRLTKTHTVRVRGRAVNNTVLSAPAPAPTAQPVAPGATQEELGARMAELGAVMADLGAQMGGSNVQVRLAPRNMNLNGLNINASVKADGTFEFPSVPAGSYTLMAISNRGNRGRAVRQSLEVGSSNIEGINLSIDPGPVVSGRVHFEGDAPPDPAPKLSVRLTPREPTPGINSAPPANVGADGAFRFDDVNPDHYNVTINTPQGYYVKSMRAGNVDALTAGLDLTSGAGSLAIEFGSNPPQVGGSVVNSEAAQPAPAVTVVLIPQEKERQGQNYFYQSTTTDQYGNFNFTRVTPGDYKVFAWEDVPSNIWYDPEFMKAYDTKGEPVSAKEGSPVNLKLTMIPAK